MNDTINLLMNHKSIRKYKNEPVTEEQLETIIAAGQMASSSSNVQAYSVIAVTDSELKDKVSSLAGNQAYINECPVFLVWCADMYRLRETAEIQAAGVETYENTMENFVVSTIDVALAAQNAAVAAESLGLGVVYIGGVRNNIEELSELLGLPELVYPVFGMCLGVPDQDPVLRPRLPLKAVLHRNGYNKEQSMAGVKEYDETLSAYMRERSNGKQSATWSEMMTKRLTEPARLQLKSFLDGKGFMKR
ncbi:NADPH-dependent oxidoreductase [Paenibacillus sp. J45TS6]|uniref:oxygen-insensitive NADPH nitroreductase n=1 Tax=unclassified Paenibacillus TaxID=185978 RepID=UPI001B0E804D|nr:oxygen-insensitive NADPH nitroreductase [Paenibacillus sp. J45TS6]GIP44292.1 NADPH-dependent oxidoreductase [Paenibacillus sp. J45TS6]